MTDWQNDAACKGMPTDWFFTEQGGTTTESRQVCASCPVADQCLEYALEHDIRYGVWGGTAELHRRRLRRGRATTTACKTCGHRIAYNRTFGVRRPVYCGDECARIGRNRVQHDSYKRRQVGRWASDEAS